MDIVTPIAPSIILIINNFLIRLEMIFNKIIIVEKIIHRKIKQRIEIIIFVIIKDNEYITVEFEISKLTNIISTILDMKFGNPNCNINSCKGVSSLID